MGKLHELMGNSAGSTTAQQSSASSLDNIPTHHQILTLIGELSDVGSREKTAKQLATLLSADELIIFVKDRELDLLLPALGFLQTFPDGKKWVEFLDNCTKNKQCKSELPFPTNSKMVPAVGLADSSNCVFVLLGGNPHARSIEYVTLLLPLLTSVFRYEQDISQIKTELTIARKSFDDTQGIAKKLDIVRRDLQSALIDKEKEIQERKLTEERLQFLSEASTMLSSTLDYKTTLSNIAKLAVPNLADWCIVYMKDENGAIHRLTIAHTDTKKAMKTQKIQNESNINQNAKTGVPYVIRTGKPILYKKANLEILTSDVFNPKEQLEIIKQFNISSWMCVPLSIRSTIFGAISFISSKKGFSYSEKDLKLAEELAGRASIAIENARLYNESQNAIALRDDFISVASHELKTPVTSLKMYVQVTKRQLEDKGVDSRNLGKMDTQINKLILLIDDLLNIARFQSGKLEYHDSEFDLNEVVDEVIENIQPTVSKHRITRKGTVERSIWADKDRIGQVLTNLLTNAVKYSPEADKVIVTLIPQKDHAVIKVQDFGIGIDKEHLDKLFERFYRVTGTEEKTFPGMGLGLYISNEIIRRYGGRMSVTSQRRKGSQFCFSVPYEQKVKNTNNYG